MKRVLDVIVALAGLILFAPVLALAALVVWLEDFRSPWFPAPRVAKGGGDFRMIKFRTMLPDAWRSGVNSTAADDPRITRAGRWLRFAKLDELPQLVNVLAGDMSLVGPRPQVRAETDRYTGEERRILTILPGLTDLASIVFADEGQILKGAGDPDQIYNSVIRPWKSRLALVYVEHRSFALNLRVLLLTGLILFSRRRALDGVQAILRQLGADQTLQRVAGRREALFYCHPPGGPEAAAPFSAEAAEA